MVAKHHPKRERLIEQVTREAASLAGHRFRR